MKLTANRNPEDDRSAVQPNIAVFFWDNFGRGELGAMAGGAARRADTAD